MFGRRKKPDATGVPAGAGVSASWLAWPTLRIGGGQLKTAGVHAHADQVRSAYRQYGSLVMAQLRLEESGQFAGAVQVLVAGVPVGHVGSGLAEKFRPVATELAAAGLPATCRAQVDVAEYLDVWLDARPERRVEADPFLPPMSPYYTTLSDGMATSLDAGLNSKAKNKRVVTTAEVVPVATEWVLRYGGEVIGAVNEPPVTRLQQAAAAGMPLTCQLRILREEGRPLRVMADLPGD